MMFLTNKELCKAFAKGATEGKTRYTGMKIEDNILYSEGGKYYGEWHPIAVRCVNSLGQTYFKVSNNARFMYGYYHTMIISNHIGELINYCIPYIIVNGWATEDKHRFHTHTRVAGVIRKWAEGYWNENFPLSCEFIRTENGVLYCGSEVLAVKRKCRNYEWVRQNGVMVRGESTKWDENICPKCSDRFACWTERDRWRKAYLLSKELTGDSQVEKALRKWCQPYIVCKGIEHEHTYCKKDIGQ